MDGSVDTTDQFELEIEGVDVTGHGVASTTDLTLRIPGAVTGDVVIAEVSHRSSHRAEAWCRLVRVKERGAAFRAPPCPHAWPVNGRCGGCPLMHVDKAVVSHLKKKQVEDALADARVDVPVTFSDSQKQLGYRNRGQFVVAVQNGQVVLGAYAQRSHDVVSMAGCRVLRPPMARVAADIARLMTLRKIPVFPEDGGIRYITLRAASNGACLVDLVVGSAEAAYLPGFGKQLLALKTVVGVSYSENSAEGNAIRTGPSTHLGGVKRVVEQVGAVGLSLTAASFSQLNREIMTVMYAKAATMVDGAVGVIWDLYAGVGGLGLTVATSCPRARLFSADVVDAASLAEENGARAGVHLHYEPLDLSTRFPHHWPTPEVVLLNPPRRGLDAVVRDGVIGLMPETIVYMSCNPKSFAGDARAFIDAGYGLDDVSTYDMLPFTGHVELIAAFRKRS